MFLGFGQAFEYSTSYTNAVSAWGGGGGFSFSYILDI